MALITLLSLSNSLMKKKDPAPARRNPNAWDVAMEPIVQNTENVAKITDVLNSNIDKTPSRYKVLGLATPGAPNPFTETSTQLYGKDPKAYYPYVDPNRPKPPVEMPKVEGRPKVYEKDQFPYYSPTPEFKIIHNEHPSKQVPISLKDVSETFPSLSGIDKMKRELNSIAIREDYFGHNFNAAERGIYYPDPKPYYDSSIDDTKERVEYLKSKIVEMQQNIKQGLKNESEVKLMTQHVHPQIQNQQNAEAEAHTKYIEENFYTEIGKDKNLKDVELPVGEHNNMPAVKVTTRPMGEVVEAEEVKANPVVEAESLEDKKGNQKVEADAKRKAGKKNLKPEKRSVITTVPEKKTAPPAKEVKKEEKDKNAKKK